MEQKQLESLVACAEGKGLPIDVGYRYYAKILVQRGLVEWIEGGGLRIYKATSFGRKQFAKMKEGKMI